MFASKSLLIEHAHICPDCPSMGYKKGDTVNISDAFESYGSLLVDLKRQNNIDNIFRRFRSRYDCR